MTSTTFDFAGRIALVTGASTGIGRATALGFGAAGATAVLADIDGERGPAVAAEIEAAGGAAIFHRADLTDRAEIDGLFAMIGERFGRLDFAHNNVGFGFGSGFLDHAPDDWDRTVDLCMKSPFLCMQHEVRIMRETGGGAIVNTASMAGVIYSALASSSYSAAKAGVIHLSAYVAMAHVHDNIRVNSVSPGLVRTEAVAKFLDDAQQIEFASREQPIGRPIEPSEIAASVLWLCSDAAGMITGHNICVAGGAQV
jgi:NAD(P)-dependent dehydrogenase (short-subunit alcohol dehydrogenase family)